MTGGRLRSHEVTLRAGPVALRPMTEGDWRLVAGWWNDPDIAHYADAENRNYTLAQVQEIVRQISRSAYCFIIEYEGKPIGDCWLQEMNLDRVLELERGRDCRRIDLEIERTYWNRGIGTAVIRLMVDFGFGTEGADAIFAIVSDYNPRSRRAFEKAGLQLYDTIPQPPNSRAAVDYALVARRSDVT